MFWALLALGLGYSLIAPSDRAMAAKLTEPDVVAAVGESPSKKSPIDHSRAFSGARRHSASLKHAVTAMSALNSTEQRGKFELPALNTQASEIQLSSKIRMWLRIARLRRLRMLCRHKSLVKWGTIRLRWPISSRFAKPSAEDVSVTASTSIAARQPCVSAKYLRPRLEPVCWQSSPLRVFGRNMRAVSAYMHDYASRRVPSGIASQHLPCMRSPSPRNRGSNFRQIRLRRRTLRFEPSLMPQKPNRWVELFWHYSRHQPVLKQS